MVQSRLADLHLLIGRLKLLFDQYAAIAALEHLVDAARERKDQGTERMAIILRQCRPMVEQSYLQDVLIKLVISKDEAEVPKAIKKAISRQKTPGQIYCREFAPGRRAHRYPYRRGGRSWASNPQRQSPRKCWVCGSETHLFANCPSKHT